MKKTEIPMNKPVYVRLLILGLSKILMLEFWYYYVRPKSGEKAKLCYMDIVSFLKKLQKMLKLDLILQIMN